MEDEAMARRKPEDIQHTPRELDIIARADRYVAYLFVGRFNKYRIECSSECEAREAARRLVDQHRRGAMVYAVAGEASALVATVRHPPTRAR
jgi:hypothetical protein